MPARPAPRTPGPREPERSERGWQAGAVAEGVIASRGGGTSRCDDGSVALNHVALTVSDRERSAEFYGTRFGVTARVHEDEHLLTCAPPTDRCWRARRERA